MKKGQLLGGEGRPVVKYVYAMSCAIETAEPIEMPFRIWTRVGIDGMYVGATWRIRLNHPCAAVMRPYVKLL